MIKRIRFLLVALIISSATIIQSQVTTSNMSGRVTDAEGTVIGTRGEFGGNAQFSNGIYFSHESAE